MDLDKYFIMKNGGRLRRGVINLNNAIHLFYKNDAVGGGSPRLLAQTRCGYANLARYAMRARLPNCTPTSAYIWFLVGQRQVLGVLRVLQFPFVIELHVCTSQVDRQQLTSLVVITYGLY